GHQERERPHRGPHPVLVADHRHALDRRRVPRPEPEVGAHRVVVDLARVRPEQVQQPHLVAVRDLGAQHRLDRLLPVVVVDLADRLEPDRPAGHVRQPFEHFRLLVSCLWVATWVTTVPMTAPSTTSPGKCTPVWTREYATAVA